MTDREAMLAAIRAAPDDDTVRLVYADWLDDHGSGDLDAATAAFLRAACPADRPRPRMPAAAYRWLDAHWQRLVPTLLAAHRQPTPDEWAAFVSVYDNSYGPRDAQPTWRRTGRFVVVNPWVRVGRTFVPGFGAADMVRPVPVVLEFARGFVVAVQAPASHPRLAAAVLADQPLAATTPAP